MRTTSLLLLLFLFCASCTDKYDHGEQTPLVEIDGSFLYEEDLQSVLPVGLSKGDSTLFTQRYIRNWVEELLLYKKAKNNIPDNREIERLVENYRKALIMHAYQQELISQKLSDEIPEQELVDFYEKNKELFQLEHPLIKGLFIKVPLNSPQLGSVRKWYKVETQTAVESLEKYSLKNAVKYEYFYNKWMSMIDVVDWMPLKMANTEEYVNRNRHIELKDTAFYYFLNVTGYRGIGEQEPYEFALPKVKEILTNRKQLNFMKQMKDDLYQQAVDKKKIIYNY